MPQVATTHVILTSALVFAALIFMLGTSVYAGYIMDLRLEMQLRNTAYYIANLAQQLYLVVNSSDFPAGPQELTKLLNIPADIEGHLYTINALIPKNVTYPAGIKNLTVTAALLDRPLLMGSATVPIGDNVDWDLNLDSIDMSRRAMVLKIAILKEPSGLLFSFKV